MQKSLLLLACLAALAPVNAGRANGRVVVAPRFYSASDFSEGLAFVDSEEFKGLIDRDGRRVFRTDSG